MTSTIVHDKHKCSKCLKNASLTCKACKATPNATDGQISSTWYCGPECQKAHWPEHKSQCKASQARRALYRAAATAKKVFYAFTKSTSHLVPFPYEIVPEVHEQEALLTFQSCNTAVSGMHNVVKILLGDLYSKVDEVSHVVKNAKYNLRQAWPGEGLLQIDGTDYAHAVIRVTTRNGETYALDLTGAQYGWDESLMPWKPYADSRVRQIEDIVPFGETKVFCKTRANDMGGHVKWAHGIEEIFAKNVDDAIMWWQRGNISTNLLLRLPEREYQEQQGSLLDVVDEFLQHCKTTQESKGALNFKGDFKYDRKFTSIVLVSKTGRRPPPSGMS